MLPKSIILCRGILRDANEKKLAKWFVKHNGEICTPVVPKVVSTYPQEPVRTLNGSVINRKKCGVESTKFGDTWEV